MAETIIISAFPGVGKSYLFANSDKLILDSDSSNFDKSDFPENYIKHIKKFIGVVDIICVSSHKEIRDALKINNINFTLVYPKLSDKETYIKRYKDRGSDNDFIKLLGSDNDFIKLLVSNWDLWLSELKNQKGCKHLILKSDGFLSDYF
jgi:hypothetical protein